jgi:hypothetical protein
MLLPSWAKRKKNINNTFGGSETVLLMSMGHPIPYHAHTKAEM